MIETRYLKILMKSFHENYSDLFKKIPWFISGKRILIKTILMQRLFIEKNVKYL